MWTTREKLQMNLDAIDRVSQTLYKKYTELLELQDERPLNGSEQDTLEYLAGRVNAVSEDFVRVHTELSRLPKITHDLTRVLLD